MFETHYHTREEIKHYHTQKIKEKNSTWDKIEPQHKLYTEARVFRFLKFIYRESRGQLVVCRSCKTIIFHTKDHFHWSFSNSIQCPTRLVHHLKYVHCVGFRVCAHIVVRSSVKCTEMGIAFMELNPMIELHSPFIKLFKLNSPIDEQKTPLTIENIILSSFPLIRFPISFSILLYSDRVSTRSCTNSGRRLRQPRRRS